MKDADILDDVPTNLWTRPTSRAQTEQRDDPLWDVLATAKFLSMSKHWVYRAVAAGTIPYRKIGNAVRFVPAEIRAWADASRRSR